jgi:hypothetical protein
LSRAPETVTKSLIRVASPKLGRGSNPTQSANMTKSLRMIRTA